MSRIQILIGIVLAAVLVAGAAAWFAMGSSSPGVILTSAAAKPAGTAAPNTDERTMGNPKAPLVVIEYAAPMCPHCAHMNAEGIPVLTAQYIKTGKVFYIFRVFPIGQPDIAAESIARCLPKQKYFGFIDLLYRKQDQWDPEYGVTDIRGGLVAVSGLAGLSPAQVDACIADKAKQQRVIDVAKYAVTRYGIRGTPTFVINGVVQTPGAQWPEIKASLDAMLAKK